MKKIIRELFFFGLVGTVGFLVDVGILYLLKPLIGLYFGRAFSFLSAVFITWLFNRLYTFKDRETNKTLLFEFAHYLSYMLAGGAINLGSYYLLIHQVRFINEQPVYAVAFGSLAGMLVNFISSRFFLYSKEKNQ
ncbi:GtrA family protein [Rahnella aceris]|jgi:putative flippase GtrA|uniref:GtrA family protein n=1 Tax=Rahnella sp. (strain Y9602) TaxID=2703885 RepID=UPI000256BC5A|nr:GtrA family protein [Rahnella aceris]AFE57945.1 GtrA family protein [Rahnella aquatilis HX2]MBU9860401.1 GtrA family protein [Rahnella aceris]